MAPTLLGEENAQSRWEAMWSGKRVVEGEPYTFLFNPTIRRQGLLGTRTYGENTRWNKRLLLQLLRARKIEILDLQTSQAESDDQSSVEWIKVKMCFSGDSGTVGRDLADLRNRELTLANEGLSQMLDYLEGRVSICRLLKRIYGPNVQLACGGCPGCRLRGLPPTRCDPLSFDTSELNGKAFALVSDLPDPSQMANRIKWREIVRSMVREKSILRFVAADSNAFILLRDIFESAFDEKAFDLYRLDQFLGLESSIFRSECVAVFHIGHVNSTLLRMRTGNRVAHFVSRGTPVTDLSGRRIGEADGWSYFPGFELWRANTNRCSQTDQ
jgi:ATP-dependent DNA helicase RecQ